MNTFKQISNVQNNGTNKAFIKIHIETIAVNLHKSTLTHRKTSVGLLSKKKVNNNNITAKQIRTSVLPDSMDDTNHRSHSCKL